MSCESCAELTLVWPIRSPGELRKAVSIVRQNIEDGTIKEILTDNGVRFDDLSPMGPWDDLVHFRFLCPLCQQTYSLAVETYHGSGGEWRPGDGRSTGS